jgi:hypothetical protein
MSETPQNHPGLITEIPAHLRIDAGEVQTTPEADVEAVQLELGERVAREVVTVTHGEPVPVERPRIPIAPEDVTPQMRVNAIGAPERRDEAGQIVPR